MSGSQDVTQKKLFSMNTFHALPKMEILKGVAIVSVALAAIAGGAYLLTMGVKGLTPVQFTDKWSHHTFWLLKGSTAQHYLSGVYLGVGAGVITMGLFVVVRYALNQLKKQSDAVRNISDKLEGNAFYRAVRLGAVALIAIGGLALIIYGIYSFNHAGGRFFDWVTDSDLGLKIALTQATGAMAAIAGGSAMLAFSICMAFKQFLQEQQVIVTKTISNNSANINDDEL